MNIICSYEATSSRKNRSLAKELTRGTIASIFLVQIFLILNAILFHGLHTFTLTIIVHLLLVILLDLIMKPDVIYLRVLRCRRLLQGFGSLFLLLASGVYV